MRPPEAFRGVRGRVLRAAGVPDEERDLRARVAELGLSDRFTFLPFTTEPGAVYRALDVVVFPNQGAGLGRPVLEAAAYGKPVVASGSPDGAGLLLPDETGILLADATPAALAEAIGRLAADEALRRRYGAAAAALAQKHEPGAIAREVEAVYGRVLGGGASV